MSDSAALPARSIRAIRGVLASSVATLIALVCHIAAGGTVPLPSLVLATLVFSWLPGIVLIGARPTAWRQAGTVIVAQALLHGLFSLEGAAMLHVPASAMRMPGMGASHTLAAESAMGGMSGGAGLMWIAHAAAAVATIALWRRGEAAFWGLVALARQSVARLSRAVRLRPVALLSVQVRAASVGTTIAPTIRLHTGTPRRGPPRLA